MNKAAKILQRFELAFQVLTGKHKNWVFIHMDSSNMVNLHMDFKFKYGRISENFPEYLFYKLAGVLSKEKSDMDMIILRRNAFGEMKRIFPSGVMPEPSHVKQYSERVDDLFISNILRPYLKRDPTQSEIKQINILTSGGNLTEFFVHYGDIQLGKIVRNSENMFEFQASVLF